MTTYGDLSPYSYTDSDVPMLNIGWLGSVLPFKTGMLDARVLPLLVKWAVDPANLMCGSHTCEFCGEESPIMIPAPGTRERKAFLGNGEIHVPGQGVVYAAPTLIVHYIIAHGYRPPDVFVDALLAHGHDECSQQFLWRGLNG
jgi:hypothetical protein